MVDWFMVFNATFNNISVITYIVAVRFIGGGTQENHWTVASHWQTWSHKMLYQVHLAWAGFELTALVVICTDCIGSNKSNYHMITNITAPWIIRQYATQYIDSTELTIDGALLMCYTCIYLYYSYLNLDN
jgi:hypothetical protein